MGAFVKIGNVLVNKYAVEQIEYRHTKTGTIAYIQYKSGNMVQVEVTPVKAQLRDLQQDLM